MGPEDGVFGVAGGIAGSLTFFVVEEVGAEGDEVMWGELFLEVIVDGILGSGAVDLSGQAMGCIGVGLGLDGASECGDFALVHVPGLGGDVDGFGKFVVPGEVVLLEVVVSVFSVVDAVGAGVEIIVDGGGGVADAGGG